MYARIYDKKHDRYYKSVVYCAVNDGWFRQYVVLNPHTGNFELVDYLDKESGENKPLVQIIRDDHEGWKKYEHALLLKHKAWCSANGVDMNVKFLWGYPEVCENYAFLFDILSRGTVQAEEAEIPIRDLADDGWNELRTQEDADGFMKLFAHFHDSTLESLTYREQSGCTSVHAVFDNSGWYGIVELCFEAVQAVNIRPAQENYSREIFEATLRVRDESVLWADWYMEEEDLSFDGSYIKALNLKWRKIG